jgi:hypothetical protein
MEGELLIILKLIDEEWVEFKNKFQKSFLHPLDIYLQLNLNQWSEKLRNGELSKDQVTNLQFKLFSSIKIQYENIQRSFLYKYFTFKVI